jgi:tRNA uridine 5-carbamoylmethylation protein Kti12
MTPDDIKKIHHVIILVGLPGSGKTTYVNNFLKTHPDYVSISSDDIIERLAKEAGTIYNDAAFNMFRDTAEREYSINLTDAINKKLNIIVDRTNQTIKARRKVLARLPKTYKKTAVVFTLPREEINQRLLKRELDTGKMIPQRAVDDMVAIYQPPTTEEGFDEIINN